MNTGEFRREVVVAGHRGDVATAVTGLSADDPDVRAAAIGALERCGALTDEQIVATLGDDHPTVRRRACLAAATRHDALGALTELLDDPDDTVVEVAAFALGERDDADDDALAALERLAVTHADSLCRESAVAALGSLGRARSLDTILAACTDKATVRRRAVLGLSQYDTPAATEMLQRLRDDRDLQVRQAAAELLSIELGEAL